MVGRKFWGGATLNVAKKAYDGDDTKELGIRFLLYGAMAEIFARSTDGNTLYGTVDAYIKNVKDMLINPASSHCRIRILRRRFHLPSS